MPSKRLPDFTRKHNFTPFRYFCRPPETFRWKLCLYSTASFIFLSKQRLFSRYGFEARNEACLGNAPYVLGLDFTTAFERFCMGNVVTRDNRILHGTRLSLFLPELVFYAHRKTTATPIASSYGNTDAQTKDTNRTEIEPRKGVCVFRSSRVRVFHVRTANP